MVNGILNCVKSIVARHHKIGHNKITGEETQQKTKQTTRTGTESQKQRSQGGISAGRRRGKVRKGTGNKKHK